MKSVLLPFSILSLITFIFFYPFFLQGKVPIPADTIVGLYHPFRDLYTNEYPRGIPYKNSLTTDPIRQQYPWRFQAIQSLKEGQLPLWNPYAFSGIPLLANLQSAVFYPLNFIFLLFSFPISWSLLVVLQPFLGGIFLYYYLQKLKISKISSFFGAIIFAFSGFSVAWMEWNTILHVALWLPLILLAKEYLLEKFSLKWSVIFIVAQCSAFFAGHIQTFFYLWCVHEIYLLGRIIQIYRQQKEQNFLSFLVRKYSPFILLECITFSITSILWIPALQLISFSARDVDLNWQKEGWFIPWQHLIQFLAPDFFGNPSTLNYWSVWNYGEFIGYIGILPLILALYTLFFRIDKKTLFFGTIFFLSLIFSLPTFFSSLPFLLHIPFISTTQPTRLLFLTDISLAILAAFGLDLFIKNPKKIMYPIILLTLCYMLVWGLTLVENLLPYGSVEHLLVARRNLYLPTFIFILSSCVLLLLQKIYKANNNKEVSNIYEKKAQVFLVYLLMFITVFDLFRFSQKFLAFSDSAYLYPQTKALDFLQKRAGEYRIMGIDDRILTPNFTVMYKLQSVEGYDPLYIRRYGEIVASSERGESNIQPPFGFNRIVTPKNYKSKFIDMMGVKYILSLNDINSEKLQKVFQEGETRIYENKNVLPRAFFIKKLSKQIGVEDKQSVIKVMFDDAFDMRTMAVIEDSKPNDTLFDKKLSVGNAKIILYSPNKVVIETNNSGDGFLVLTDSYYPTWSAQIIHKDISQAISTKIFRTNYSFRGIFVPKGHTLVEFNNALF